MSPEGWPSNTLEAYRYTDLSKIGALELPDGSIQCTGSLPADILTQAGRYTLEHFIPAARCASARYLRVARGVEVTLVETLTSAAPGVGAARQKLVIELEDGARLTHLRRQQLETSAFHWGETKITVARDASYTYMALNSGAALARQDLEITLAALGAQAAVYALQLLSEDQQGDLTTVIEHQAPQTTSDQLIKNVLTGRARGVYQGRIRVAPGAQKTNGQQQSRALLLSPQAEMNTKPELEIFADDVSCSHGAAVGALDEQVLYYLRARGLSCPQARSLLIGAFVDEILEKIAAPDVQSAWQREAQTWLQQHA